MEVEDEGNLVKKKIESIRKGKQWYIWKTY